MSISKWPQLDFELVEALTCKVRVLSGLQIEKGWPERNTKQVLAAIHRLRTSGLITAAQWSCPMIPFTGIPVQHWSPGDPFPDTDRIADHVRSRWSARCCQQTVFAAMTRAARLFGGTGNGFPPKHHQNHDLLLAEVFVSYRRTKPKVAARWIGEDLLPSAEQGIKNPDAFILNPEGEVMRVIESAGRYSRDQIESFHEHCEVNQLAYELW